jgi:peptidoglycan/LPS O-acetylase OafA/YrhL
MHASGNSYRPDIDGLRAVAVTAVVLYHAGIPVFRFGFVGVDVFFVISGFLIGQIVYLDVKSGNFRFGKFYARRIRRIVPALLVVVIAALLAGAAILTTSELKDTSWTAVSALLGFSNMHFWSKVGYFSSDAGLDPLLMTWTLGVEEQFYLLLPLLLLGLRRLGPGPNLSAILLLTIASLVACVVVTGLEPTAAFYLIPFRAWELGTGVMLAVWAPWRKSLPGGIAVEAIGIASLLGLLASVCLLGDTSRPDVSALLPVAATAALILTRESAVNRRILSTPWLVGIGLVSYSWYLWHWPIITFLKLCTVRPPSIAAMGLAAALSLVIAIGSWRYVEQPFRRGSLRTSTILIWFPVAVTAALSVPAFFLLAHGLPDRFPGRLAAIDRMVQETHSVPCVNYHADLRRICVATVPDRPMIAIIGDSHAAALGPAIRALAASARWGSAVLAKSSCRPLKGVTVQMKQNPGFAAECSEFMSEAFDWIAKNPSVGTVVLAGFWVGPITNPDERYQRSTGVSGEDGDGLLAEGLRQAILDLQKTGKRVFVAQDTPYWPFNPANALKIGSIPFRSLVQHIVDPGFDMSASTAEAYPPDTSVEAILRAAAETTGAGYLPMRDIFCVERKRCRYRDGDMPLFADQSHVTALGAEMAIVPHRSVLVGDGGAHRGASETSAR